MIWVVVIPFLAAVASPWVVRRARPWAGPILALAPLAGLGILASWLPITGDAVTLEAYAWAPQLGVDLAFRLDGLSMAFALLITGIGVVVVLYSGGYLHDEPRLGAFYAYLLAFMGAMLGLVLSDNVLSLFVFWELTSVFSYLLIGFNHDDPLNRKKALKALLVTGGGGLALLAGLVLLVVIGTQQGLTVAEAARLSNLLPLDVTTSPLYTPALLLIAVGCFTKSAQWPFHFWLPAAMAGPTPVSSFLHSATMVKAGVFLLARLHPMMGGTPLWVTLITTVGAVTMIVGAAMAVAQRDMKYVLAYTTVGVLGTLTMLLGPGSSLAIKAMVVFLVAHALYKATLFQVAGNVDHETGTRDLLSLGGLARLMPITAAAAALAALSKSGFPGTLGFLGKELVYKAKLDLETLGGLLVVVALLANIFLTATALMVAWWPFFGKTRGDTPRKPHEAPWSMTYGPLALGIAGVGVGLLPWAFEDVVGAAMASTIYGQAKVLDLQLIPAITTQVLIAFALSVVTLAGGFALFTRLRRWVTPMGEKLSQAERVGPARGYDLAYAGLLSGSKRVTGFVQHGSLRGYVVTFVVVIVAAVAWPVVRWAASGAELGLAPGFLDDVYVHEALLALVIMAGAIGTCVLRGLAAVASVGLSGLGIAALFAVMSAPDLALTQVMVETLTVVLLVFIFYALPQREGPFRTGPRRVVDLAVAIAAGGTLGVLLVGAASVAEPAWVSQTMAQWSVPRAMGQNVVNVILVDFRSLDTLGEVVVVAVAALGVIAMWRLRPGLGGGLAAGGRRDRQIREGGGR